MVRAERPHVDDLLLKMHLTDRVSPVLLDFTRWLQAYGETSWDHQSFFAGPTGRLAKSLYYRTRLIGTAAVAPMIFLEAFVPGGRRLFHHPIRFPIADAHYAMGFAFLYEATSEGKYLDRAIHFLHELKKSRSPYFEEYLLGISLRLGLAGRDHREANSADHHDAVLL